MSNPRHAAAIALLNLIGKGTNTTFPFPDEDYRNALSVIAALALCLSSPQAETVEPVNALCRWCGQRERAHPDPWCKVCLSQYPHMAESRAKVLREGAE